MNLSLLNDFFKNNLTTIELGKNIKNEVLEYKKSLKTIGKSSPIYLNEDIKKIEIGRTELSRLCKAFLTNDLNEYEMGYIADAILLSNNVDFENEYLMELFELLTDPEINGTLTIDSVENILAQIKPKAD